MTDPGALRALQADLLTAYGPQHWWPATGRFEVLVGAVLTQNTAWTNVEKAIANLRAAGLLDAHALLAESTAALAAMIRPAGTFNVKAVRLHALCRWFSDHGGFAALDTWPTPKLRTQLLAVHGIGRETADAMLLYAFRRPVFVVDDYARRILGRLALIDGEPDYETLRADIEAAAPGETQWFNELHALLVAHAKAHCRTRPRCVDCPLRAQCPSAGRL